MPGTFWYPMLYAQAHIQNKGLSPYPPSLLAISRHDMEDINVGPLKFRNTCKSLLIFYTFVFSPYDTFIFITHKI